MHQKGWTHSNKETYLGGVSATQEYTSFGGGGGDDQTQTFLPFPPPPNLPKGLTVVLRGMATLILYALLPPRTLFPWKQDFGGEYEILNLNYY